MYVTICYILFISIFSGVRITIVYCYYASEIERLLLCMTLETRVAAGILGGAISVSKWGWGEKAQQCLKTRGYWLAGQRLHLE